MKSQYLEHEGIQIASGRTLNTSHINKFGFNESVGTTFEPITDLGTNHLPTTAAVVSVSSSSSQDTDGGTGAHSVEIEGLDQDYAQVIENVTMNGTGTVSTTTTFLRVFRMRVIEAGSNETNSGNIDASVGGTDVARISSDLGQTLMACYTIPARKKGYLVKFQGSISKNQEAQFKLRSNLANDGAWNLKGLWGTFGSTVTYDYPVPIEFTQKTDIQIMGKAGATSEMGAILDLILVDM